MRKKEYALVSVSLLISLFIYLFYRTDKTLINEFTIQLISIETYTGLKAYIVNALPLNHVVIYSLPEGLWIFCITLTSKPYYINLKRWRIDCVYFPLIFGVSLEVLQLIHVTNGRFDFIDIGVFVVLWLLGRYGLPHSLKKQHLFTTVNFKTGVCLASYGIVYLAHVFK
jgi:hypothetical protein